MEKIKDWLSRRACIRFFLYWGEIVHRAACIATKAVFDMKGLLVTVCGALALFGIAALNPNSVLPVTWIDFLKSSPLALVVPLAGIAVGWIIVFFLNIPYQPAAWHYEVAPVKSNLSVTAECDHPDNEPDRTTGIFIKIENLGSDDVTNVSVWRKNLTSPRNKHKVSIDENLSPTNTLFSEWVNPSDKHTIIKGGHALIRIVSNKDNHLLFLLNPPYHVIGTILTQKKLTNDRTQDWQYIVCDVELKITGQRMNGDVIEPVSFKFEFLFERLISRWITNKFAWGEITEPEYSDSYISMGEDMRKQLERIYTQHEIDYPEEA